MCMKIKFRPLGLPFWGHRRADYMFTAGIGVGRRAAFMGRGRDSLFEPRSCGKARKAALKASDVYRPRGLWPRAVQSWHQTGAFSPEDSVCSPRGMWLLEHRFSPPPPIPLSHAPRLLLATLPFRRQRIRPREEPAFWTTGERRLVMPR